jgi:hypothetical protein
VGERSFVMLVQLQWKLLRSRGLLFRVEMALL